VVQRGGQSRQRGTIGVEGVPNSVGSGGESLRLDTQWAISIAVGEQDAGRVSWSWTVG